MPADELFLVNGQTSLASVVLLNVVHFVILTK